MAAFTVARRSGGLLSGLRTSFRSLAPVKYAALQPTNQPGARRWSSAGALSVKQRIDEKRKMALCGGGQNRIDAQHKKVMSVCCSFWPTSNVEKACLRLASRSVRTAQERVVDALNGSKSLLVARVPSLLKHIHDL